MSGNEGEKIKNTHYSCHMVSFIQPVLIPKISVLISIFEKEKQQIFTFEKLEAESFSVLSIINYLNRCRFIPIIVSDTKADVNLTAQCKIWNKVRP